LLLLPVSGKPKTATDRKPFKLTSNDNGSDSRDPDSQFQTATHSLSRKIHAKYKMQCHARGATKNKPNPKPWLPIDGQCAGLAWTGLGNKNEAAKERNDQNGS